MSKVSKPAVTPSSNSGKADAWYQRVAESSAVLPLMFVLSMLESIIIPIPLELILIPLLIHQRERLWAIATVVLAGCLVGASIGYGVGLWLFDDIGDAILTYFGYSQAFEQFTTQFQQHGFVTLLLTGITPIPFQVGMLAAGSSNYPFSLFMLAAVIARGLRYYGLALLVYWFGPLVLGWWQQHSRKAGWLLLTLLGGGYAVYLLV
ncbi:YqaA family protein [Pseudidiomarina sp. WS423]|uniref:YqaA family protein n=1 Tax=Pseudidiomarina sp. WS423 TaxID=3425124 RepID=UPI003D6DE5A3